MIRTNTVTKTNCRIKLPWFNFSHEREEYIEKLEGECAGAPAGMGDSRPRADARTLLIMLVVLLAAGLIMSLGLEVYAMLALQMMSVFR